VDGGFFTGFQVAGDGVGVYFAGEFCLDGLPAVVEIHGFQGAVLPLDIHLVNIGQGALGDEEIAGLAVGGVEVDENGLVVDAAVVPGSGDDAVTEGLGDKEKGRQGEEEKV